MAYKAKADTSFHAKLDKAHAERDWARTEQLFNQYGQYLELIEAKPQSEPPTETTIKFYPWQMTPTKRVRVGTFAPLADSEVKVSEFAHVLDSERDDRVFCEITTKPVLTMSAR